MNNFDWSPDGRSIAFTMTDPKTDEEEKNDKGKNDSRWIDENVKMARLYVLSIQKDANGKREPRKLTTGNYHVDDFDWSNDSSRIAFSHVKSPVANDWPTADVSIIEVGQRQRYRPGQHERRRNLLRFIHPMENRSLCLPSDIRALGTNGRDSDLLRQAADNLRTLSSFV